MSNSEPTAGQIGTRHEQPAPAPDPIFGRQKPPRQPGECAICWGGGQCVPDSLWCPRFTPPAAAQTCPVGWCKPDASGPENCPLCGLNAPDHGFTEFGRADKKSVFAANGQALEMVNVEWSDISRKYGPEFSSPHELWGVLQEEFEEFKDEIKANNPDGVIAELTQVAAVALRGLAYFIRLRAAGAPTRF